MIKLICIDQSLDFSFFLDFKYLRVDDTYAVERCNGALHFEIENLISFVK